ncbi:hypothetical protein ANTRET_LOCUS6134 [Anthophora retusa]
MKDLRKKINFVRHGDIGGKYRAEETHCPVSETHEPTSEALATTCEPGKNPELASPLKETLPARVIIIVNVVEIVPFVSPLLENLPRLE